MMHTHTTLPSSRRTRIKICGIRTVDDALAAVDAGADAVGLVFAAGSPRRVSLAEASAIVGVLPPLVEPVALFTDTSLDDMRRLIDALGLRTVQFHGSQTPDDVAALAPVRVIQAVPFDEAFMATRLPIWRDSPVAALLIDAPPPRDAAIAGGHGVTFDWAALADLIGQRQGQPLPPIFLAGGLTPENVGRAIAQVKPFAVDVSSGVESSRGMKSTARIHAFCEAVRQADARSGQAD